MNHSDCLHCRSYSKSIFGSCDARMVTKAISDTALPLMFKKGQDIYLEGSPVKGVFCIKNGKVKVYKTCDNRHLTVDLSANGDLLGFTGLYTGGTYINSARCLEDSEICFIPEKTFKKLINSNNDLLLELLKRCSLENNNLSNLAKRFKCKNTLSRLAKALSDLREKFGTDENGCFNIMLTRRDISEISGTTTESAIRILNELKKEKVITFQENRIKILDSNKLLKYQTLSA